MVRAVCGAVSDQSLPVHPQHILPTKAQLFVLLFLRGNLKFLRPPAMRNVLLKLPLPQLHPGLPHVHPCGALQGIQEQKVHLHLQRQLCCLTGSAHPQQVPSPPLHPQTCPRMRPEHQSTSPGSPRVTPPVAGSAASPPAQEDPCACPKRDINTCYFTCF